MARKKIVVVDPKKMKWEPVEDPRCDKRVWAKLLWTDKKTGAVAVLAKFPKGFHEARHKHPSDAHVLVLEGKLVDEKGNEIKKGMYWFVPAGVEHGDRSIDHAPEGCVAFVYFNGPPQ